MASSFKIEQMSFADRREVLSELLESDGHNTPVIAQKLSRKGIRSARVV